jgi:hypothetical protein
VDVYFQNEDIFLSQESSELILTLHAALAQAESEDKSSNIKWSIKRSSIYPDSPAFSRPYYGYDRDKNKNLVINEQGWSIVRIKRELEASRIPSPRGKRRWAFSTIREILSNEKYAGASVYGKTVASEYPATKRVRNEADKAVKSENHHPPIIDKDCFNQVQENRKMRSNIELDEIRKNTHYSMKNSSDI